VSDNKSDSTEHVTRAPRKDSSRMKVIAVVTLVALSLGLFGGWAIAALSQPDADGDLWAIPARGAQATSDSIVLLNPAASVIGVTVDGERTANQEPISKVVQSWTDVFGDTTPRAILTGTSASGSHSVIVELGEPEATVDTITFPAVTVGGEAIPEFEVVDAVLVIDGAGVLEAGEAAVALGLGD
jgi:hypothetical protein